MSDFDKGFGIGGMGRHDEVGDVSEMIARGEIQVTERTRKGPMPNGQLWEPCPICGQEPVCLDCGRCVDHCHC
jgi:hypothetical protein